MRGRSFVRDRPRRKVDGAAGPGQTDSLAPVFAEPCTTGARFGTRRLFFWTVHGPFSFRQDEKKMGGVFSGNLPASPRRAAAQIHSAPARGKTR